MAGRRYAPQGCSTHKWPGTDTPGETSTLLTSAAPRPPAQARPPEKKRGAEANQWGGGWDPAKVKRQRRRGAGAVVSREASERVISWMRRFDLARIKTQLSARRLTKITVQLNKKNYLITQACSLVVKLKELQACVNIAALQTALFYRNSGAALTCVSSTELN